jgi:hypothetical protein
MGRFFGSLLVALIIGAGIGLYLGWAAFPAQTDAAGAAALARRHQDEYTAMIAAGYQVDGDLIAVAERLRVIGVTDVPSFVQTTAERAIDNSIDLESIRDLVALSEALGRLTPVMEAYRRVEDRPAEGSG